MAKRSAGLLLYRRGEGGQVEVMLGHMGGPYWKGKDERAWSIPKGGVMPGEDPLAAARREFEEEIGRPVPEGPLVDLGTIRQSAKTVRGWALEADIDVRRIESLKVEMEWPPRTGRMRKFPEIDRAGWFDVETARRKIVAGQAGLLDALLERLGVAG